MNWDGPDSISSWLISFVCCFIYIIMFGISKLSGVLFVASISRFKVGRQQASFPYTFASAIKNLSGPLVGYLGFKFNVRTVSAFGALIGAVAVGACFFAESITLVTYLYGVFFGLGFGLGVNLLPITINQYFDKHRGTASSISFSGICVGSLILPPIVEILLNNYGLSQTFLFLSGFILMCIPAALLLRKPMFEIEKRNPYNEKQEETQGYVSGANQPFYTIEKNYNNSKMLQTSNSDTNSFSAIIENINENDKIVMYEGRSKKLTTETLLYGSSVPMSYSKRAENDEIMEERKEILKIQKDKTFNLSSDNAHHCKFRMKFDMFDKNIYSSNVRCQQSDKYSQCSSNNRTSFDKLNNTLDGIPSELYQNYGYQSDEDEIRNSIFSNSTDVVYQTKSPAFEHGGKQFPNYSSLTQGYPDEIINASSTVKHLPHYSIENPKLFEFSDRKIKIAVDEQSQYTETKAISPLRSFSVICDPMFVLIAVTNAIHTFAIVSMMAVIVDFSRDLHIEESNQKYILMLYSVGDIVGRLCVCWITDRGYMSTPAFTALCFAGQGIFSAAIARSTDFISLVALVTLYGSSQASLISVFPVIIAQFIEDDKQTIAIPSSHFLSGPLCLAISPLIGYFRGEVGAYDWIFYLITLMSAASSVSWIFVSVKQKCWKKNRSFLPIT